ncbi:heavy metal translocating P-type ATPase [Allopusillimonas ginsengisoli]|uniref:heavy metal translocating P-type ATPase n=1 Tax=Allopusillimonas ginsengisoli TaxID=453575 RepID=UPI0039C4C846
MEQSLRTPDGARVAAGPADLAIDLSVQGMTCASCVGRVERALAAVPGVARASVNLATEQAHIQIATGVTGDALVQAVAKAGYEARVLSDDNRHTDDADARHDAEADALRKALWLSALLTLPVFILEMGSHLIPGVHRLLANSIGMQNSWYLQFVLTTVVLLLPGRRFFTIGIPALLRRTPDMNSLVALGAGAAYAYSVVATFFPFLLPPSAINVYYEAAAVIVTLILLGRWLEAGAKGRTSEAIKRLMKLQPDTARVLRDGNWTDASVSSLSRGETVALRPGERVPVDGVVIEGSSYIDESMISGEPVPVQKTEGTGVVAGTVNQSGALTLKVTKTGADTVLAQIIRMVERAQADKLPIQAVVDRITMWFVPAVMAAAALTFLVWLFVGPTPALTFALVNAVAVLIIACPCAMGLATPTSIMVGTGRAAQLGVLFRKGDALQALRDARVVAVDKTGTLTEGKPALTDLIAASGFDRSTVLRQVAAVEARSEHPIAQAIVQAAQQEGLSLAPATEFSTQTGAGIAAQTEGVLVQVGADRFMRSLGIDVEVFSDQVLRLAEEGKTPVYAAVDGQLAAMIAVSDPIKPSTGQAIKAMHDLGLKVVMVTGDSRRTGEAIARQLGIDEVIAEVMPEGKVEAINALKQRYGMLAFVGDGINDAPALAAADIGIAIGTGTDIAMEAADVVLMSGDMGGVPTAIDISRATLANIRQNLFWAFAYNTALIPIAAGVLYPINGVLLSPIFAAGAMAMSSVFVVGNALRLKRFSPHVHA